MSMTPITIQFDQEQLAEVVRQAIREELASTSGSILTKKQAAKYLGMSTVSLWKYERRGIIKPIVIGGRECYTRKNLDEFLQGATVAA